MNMPATVDNAPTSTITSKPMIVYGIHDAIALPPVISGQYSDDQMAIQ